MHTLFNALAVAFLVVANITLLHAQSATTTLFRNVNVFDGTKTLGIRDVLIRDGRIARIAARVDAPAGTTIIDGTGKTLLPGLIDSHTHTWADAGKAALPFGVTTEIDMFTDVAIARTARTEQLAGKAVDRADLFSAGTLVTAPKGHGAEYGIAIPTITKPEEAQAFVDARIAEGSDFIKIVYDNGHSYGMKLPTLSRETMRAVIDATHRRQKLAVVHIGDLHSAREAIAAGADGLVHLFADSAPTADLIALARQNKTFVIPTLTVVMSITGTPGAAPLLADTRLTRHIARQDSIIMAQAFPKRPGAPALDFTHAQRTVRALYDAGVPILAGTDAGNPGTAHGIALHRELELLVQSGMTPSAALASATSISAKALGMKDRGSIAEGLRADLLLVDGDPTQSIVATRQIDGVWKQGERYDRDAHARTIAAGREALSKAPVGSASGLVSNFDDGDAKSSFGAGWMISDDAMAGGASSASMKVVVGGANGSSYALQTTGTVDGKVPHAWAGVMYSPGAQVFQPANLTDKKEIRFWAKGDGKTYRLMLFVESKGYVPLSQNFVAGAEWTEHVFTFSSFGIDGKGVMAVIFAAGPAPGPFSILIDEVRFK